MKKPPMTDEEFEKLLEEAKPDLRLIRKNSPPITQERIERLHKKLAAIRPFSQKLTKQQMRKLFLEFLDKREMDGSDLADLVQKNNIKLKDATGEGELYGLLRELENARLIERKPIGGTERRKKEYSLTKAGHAELRQVSGEQSELAQWLIGRLAS